jgi:hypothetical protein
MTLMMDIRDRPQNKKTCLVCFGVASGASFAALAYRSQPSRTPLHFAKKPCRQRTQDVQHVCVGSVREERGTHALWWGCLRIISDFMLIGREEL